MASYFLRSKHISRGKGARATRAAAYRAGERIRDERTSEVYNYSDRDDVATKGIVLASQWNGRAEMNWARDRSTLWNAAEHSGKRCNSRLAREVLVLVPPELTPTQRADLVRAFSKELANRYQCAVDFAIHRPHSYADPRNHHAHLLMTTREISPEGLGRRTALEGWGRDRRAAGFRSSKAEYLLIRERWAQLTNGALKDAGLATRVDHRSLADQGINREPTPTIPEKVFYAERRSGIHSQAGDAIRARHRERVEARMQGTDELARVVQRQKQEASRQASERERRAREEPKRKPWGALTRDERNQRRREQYKLYRERLRRDPARLGRERQKSRERARARWKANSAAIKERRRQWRHAHAAEINRKQREYRRAHAAEINRKRREYRKARVMRETERKMQQLLPQQQAVQASDRVPANQPPASLAQTPTAEDSVRNWLAFRERQADTPAADPFASLREAHTNPPPGPTDALQVPTAQESVSSWLEFRRTQNAGPTAEGSVQNWLAFREQQKELESAQTAREERSTGQRPIGSLEGPEEDAVEGAKNDRHLDKDFSL